VRKSIEKPVIERDAEVRNESEGNDDDDTR
jgi:hypothetical protein